MENTVQRAMDVGVQHVVVAGMSEASSALSSAVTRQHVTVPRVRSVRASSSARVPGTSAGTAAQVGPSV